MKHTNKETLAKGVRFLAGALPLAFIGPSVVYSAFNNQDKPLYWPILISGLLACAGAIYLMYRGIKTLMRALFDD